MFVIVALIGIAPAHDIWINQQGLKNPAGEWCCGKMDCGVLSDGAVKPVEGGYAIDGTMYVEEAHKAYPVHEFVPNAEAQPSPDGAYWRCALFLEHPEMVYEGRKAGPGGIRRCFFFPPPNT